MLITSINRDVENILSQKFKPSSSYILEMYFFLKKCTSEQACYLSLTLIRWKQKNTDIAHNLQRVHAVMPPHITFSMGPEVTKPPIPHLIWIWEKSFAHRMHGKRKRCYQLKNGDDPAIHRLGSAPKLWPLTAAWTHFWVAPICGIYGRFLAPQQKTSHGNFKQKPRWRRWNMALTQVSLHILPSHFPSPAVWQRAWTAR